MPICPNGHAVEPDAAFCHQCGASMTPWEDATLVELPPVVTAPGSRRAISSQSNTAVYVLAGVIVVIGLAAIGFVLVSQSDGGSRHPAGTAPTSTTTSTATPSPHTSASAAAGAVPAGGTRCPGSVDGGGPYGTIGSETSCGFVQAVYQSFVDTAGLNESPGQTVTVSATSPATHRTYTNIQCTVGSPWVTCVGGNGNTAKMFFAHP